MTEQNQEGESEHKIKPKHRAYEESSSRSLEMLTKTVCCSQLSSYPCDRVHEENKKKKI